jgi:hypothetical protein
MFILFIYVFIFIQRSCSQIMFLGMHGTCLNFKYILCLHELLFGDSRDLQSSNFIIYISEPYGHDLVWEFFKTKFFWCVAN